jgi:hypothetical protein
VPRRGLRARKGKEVVNGLARTWISAFRGDGDGRAVAQTVVITFFGVWLINSLFNIGYLSVFPDALGIKG